MNPLWVFSLNLLILPNHLFRIFFWFSDLFLLFKILLSPLPSSIMKIKCFFRVISYFLNLWAFSRNIWSSIYSTPSFVPSKHTLIIKPFLYSRFILLLCLVRTWILMLWLLKLINCHFVINFAEFIIRQNIKSLHDFIQLILIKQWNIRMILFTQLKIAFLYFRKACIPFKI